MLVITLYFSYIIHTIAQKISESLKQYYLTVSPEQVLTEADAIHNALILIGCSIALLIVSLFSVIVYHVLNKDDFNLLIRESSLLFMIPRHKVSG